MFGRYSGDDTLGITQKKNKLRLDPPQTFSISWGRQVEGREIIWPSPALENQFGYIFAGVGYPDRGYLPKLGLPVQNLTNSNRV